jgi:hypothetical protein
MEAEAVKALAVTVELTLVVEVAVEVTTVLVVLVVQELLLFVTRLQSRSKEIKHAN